jgi:hypothetical protein
MTTDIEYKLYVEYAEKTEWGIRIDEFSVPSFLSKSVNFIKDLSSKLSLKLTDVMKLFANKSVFQFFQKIKWNLDYLFKIVKDGHRAYTQVISAISEYVAKTKVGKWTEDKLKDLDKWLQNHPKLKRIGGIVVAGLLIYIWFNMTFIGDAKYDFNLTDAYAALSGKFSLANLFAGTSGTQLLLLFATGVIGISFPWPGPASVKFLYAMIKSLADWAKLKLQKEHIYMNGDINMKLKEILNKSIRESSGVAGGSGESIPSGNNSARWTAPGQRRWVKIEQLSGYEQIDFPVADSLDISSEPYHWEGVGNTKKYHNKVRAIRGEDGVIKLEHTMKLQNIISESKGIFKHRIKLFPYEFYKLSDNYKKLNPSNKVIKDKKTMKDIDSIDPVYIGYNPKTKEVHWRWIEDDMELHIDSGKVVPDVWNLIKRFDKVKDNHIWK